MEPRTYNFVKTKDDKYGITRQGPTGGDVRSSFEDLASAVDLVILESWEHTGRAFRPALGNNLTGGESKITEAEMNFVRRVSDAYRALSDVLGRVESVRGRVLDNPNDVLTEGVHY